MRISHEFEYFAHPIEISDEFCEHDSEDQASVINHIGVTFKGWGRGPKKTAAQVQLLEIAEQLDEDGKWFIETLCEYMRGE